MATIVYLMHAQPPDTQASRRPAHYIGSTRPDQFPRRMRAHLHGHGTVRTSKMWEAGYVFTLVGIWFAETRSLEYALQRSLPLPEACPLCNRLLHSSAPAQAKFVAIDFSTKDYRREKGGEP